MGPLAWARRRRQERDDRIGTEAHAKAIADGATEADAQQAAAKAVRRARRRRIAIISSGAHG